MSKKSLVLKVGILALLAMLLASTNPGAVIAGPKSCDSRVNNTQNKLQECVTVEGVREHQAAFQAIPGLKPVREGCHLQQKMPHTLPRAAQASSPAAQHAAYLCHRSG